MSKTYSLSATLNTGHLNGSDTMEQSWSNFLTWNDAASNVGYAGYDSPYWRYATNMLFDSSTLASLRNKVSNGISITGLTLTVNCTQAMTGETLIGYKANSTASGSGSSGAWARCNNDGTAGSGDNSVAFKIEAHTLSTGTQTFALKRTTPYSGIPQYGLVAGPQTSVTGRWRFTSATLNVTTNEITVNYYKGSYGSGNNATDTIVSGGSLRGAGTFSRTGYTQTGWSVNSNGSTKDYNLSATYSGTSDLTLYPYWTIISYIVSYNLNGGSGTGFNNQTKNYGASVTIYSNKPNPPSGTSAGSYTVTYNANGGSVTPASVSAARTTNYTFSVWNTAQNGSGTSYAAGATYSANASATLYAQYTSATTTAAVALPTPTRTGYTFNGWHTAASGGTRVGGGGSSYTPTGNVTLYAQWTASSATLSSVTSSVDCGNNLTGSWTSTGNYYYKLKVTCGNATATWSDPTSAGAQSASVQIPTTWYSMDASLNGPLRDTTSATATCELYTYSNSACTTQVGTASSKTFTVKVPTSVVPSLSTLTATSSSTNAVVSGWGQSTFVQGYSKVTLAQTVSNWYGSRIASVRYTGPGLDSTMTSLTTSDESSVINTAGTLTYTATVTDTRGRSASKTVPVTFQPYAQPSVAGIAVQRCDSDGTVNNAAGAYFKATPVYSFSSVTVSDTAKNALVTQNIKYRVHPNGAWSTATTCASESTYGPWSSSLTNSYDVMVTLADRIQNGSSQTTTFTTTLPTVQGVWIGKGNDRLGLGGVPPAAGLHCDWDATFNGTLDVTPRRCYGDMTTGGKWYNVLEFSAENANQASGYIGAIVDFYITRNGYGEAHSVRLNLVAGEICFSNEKSISSALNIDQIRYRYNGTYGYVDIHNTTGATSVAVSFDVRTRYDALGEFSSVSLTQIADAPIHNGVSDTIATTYTLSANTNATGTFTGATGVTISESDIKRSGNNVYVHFYAQKSFSANSEQTVGTLSGVPFPSKNVRWLAGGGSAAYNATTPVYAILDTSGTLKIYPSAAIGAVNITVSYIV